jgi:DNA-binding CsgD family transcriptional regulator
MTSRIEKLTSAQQECLAMVADLKTSKQIALELGVTSHAIDARIKRILLALQVDSRDEAARIYLDEVGRSAYQPLVCQSPDIDRGQGFPTLAASAPLNNGSGAPVGELRDSAVAQFGSYRGWSLTLPLQTHSNQKNDLPWNARLAWIMIIMLALIVGLSFLISGVEGLSRLL